MILFHIIYILTFLNFSEPLLYPKASETREVLILDGFWNFVVDREDIGHEEEWYLENLEFKEDAIFMPVPSSYNDIGQDATIRHHVGFVWYDRTFYVPKQWEEQNVFLHFSSVHYAAEVWVNKEFAIRHDIGHLPFEVDVTSLLVYGEENRITVACDNRLNSTTIPQGSVFFQNTDNGQRLNQAYTFDFFNYAGIHRSVILHTKPNVYLKNVQAFVENIIIGETSEASINYKVNMNVFIEDLYIAVNIYDKQGNFKTGVSTKLGNRLTKEGNLFMKNVNLWWPYLMHPHPGYLYYVEFKVISKGKTIDTCKIPIGIRSLTWDKKSFKINNKPVYLHGFGKHEDADIRGKGLDLPLIMKDYNLIKWIGANVFRTSHYPYAEEIMDMADKLGIMVIDEVPAVNVENFDDALLQAHLDSITQLINRDINRPSVIAWSIANEPRSANQGAENYFRQVAEYTRSLDPSRPITAAIAQAYDKDQASQFLDIIGFNRYNAWYSNAGKLDMIVNNVIEEATNFHNKFNKPVYMAEYGADTMEGLHISPEFIWSEEYQVKLMSNHFKAFDVLRQEEWFIGEFIWNFADFKTDQDYTRVGGNKKGVFTRTRQPKASAHHLRKRYFYLENELNDVPLPDDLFDYISSSVDLKDEL